MYTFHYARHLLVCLLSLFGRRRVVLGVSRNTASWIMIHIVVYNEYRTSCTTFGRVTCLFSRCQEKFMKCINIRRHMRWDKFSKWNNMRLCFVPDLANIFKAVI